MHLLAPNTLICAFAPVHREPNRRADTFADEVAIGVTITPTN